MADGSDASAKQACTASSGGVEWRLELDRTILIPGQLVTGRLSLVANDDVDARGLVVALTAVEHWKHRESSTDGQGHTTTRVVTSTQEVIREPVQVRGDVHLGAGETLATELSLPVPPDGPASLEAEDAGLEWTVEAKLDIPGGFDSGLAAAVVVAQPTALLRAGAVTLGELALYDAADAASDEITATIALSPAPLVCGAPFTGHVDLRVPEGTNVRGVRAEVRVHVEATVSSGENETLTLWTGDLLPQVVAGKQDVGGSRSLAVAGALPATPVPSIELPHGRTSATFHVILDRPFAPDTHLVRDIAIATTAEI
jgi:hypothetical protein